MEKHEAVSKNNAAAIPARKIRRRAFRLMFSSALFVLAASIISCKPSPDEENWFGNILEMCLSPLSSRTEYVYEDMYDGTIRRTELQHGGTVCEGPRVYTMSVGYIKKCLQGQVYVSDPMDPDYNTCRGTGGSPDWGAVKYEFCASNNRDCDMLVSNPNGSDYYIADPTKSPAAISCAGDATAGKNWKMVHTIGIPDTSDPFMKLPNANIYMPDMPKGNTNLIWTDFSKSDITLANTFYFDSVSGYEMYQTGDVLKSSLNYVLCVNQ